MNSNIPWNFSIPFKPNNGLGSNSGIDLPIHCNQKDPARWKYLLMAKQVPDSNSTKSGMSVRANF